MAEDQIKIIEVIYATPEVQHLISVPFVDGLTAMQAVEASEILSLCPEIDATALVLGVYGERVAPDKPLRAGSRVEVCRPLQHDPRDLRSERVARGSFMGKSA